MLFLLLVSLCLGNKGGKMQCKDIRKRTRKAVKNNLERLIKKYGLEEVRMIVNKYFEKHREKIKLEAEISDSEKKLLRLKRKL